MPEEARSRGRARCAGTVGDLASSLGREGLAAQAGCPLCIPPAARGPVPHFAPPVLLRPQDVRKECLEELATHSISLGGRQAWMGPLSGPDRPTSEKPRAGRCGKWLFGSEAELLNVLDRLASPRSLLTRTRQIFGAGRGIQGQTRHDNPPQCISPNKHPAATEGEEGVPGVRTSPAAALSHPRPLIWSIWTPALPNCIPSLFSLSPRPPPFHNPHYEEALPRLPDRREAEQPRFDAQVRPYFGACTVLG